MSKKIYLISNGDFRDTACQECWPKQQETLKAVEGAFSQLGYETEILPQFDSHRGHGFITKQYEGTQVFSQIEPSAPVVIVLSIWAYSHHVCGPLQTHKGPILLLANFDGTWPGLVALLNHTGTLDRLCVKHSRLWSESFADDDPFMQQLKSWCENGEVSHDTSHLADAEALTLSSGANEFGRELAANIIRTKRIMGQLDPGCMGMLNALINPAKLGAIGLPVELLNQSDLLAEMELVSDEEAQGHLNWLVAKGVWFNWGADQYENLVHSQVLMQMKKVNVKYKLMRGVKESHQRIFGHLRAWVPCSVRPVFLSTSTIERTYPGAYFVLSASQV